MIVTTEPQKNLIDAFFYVTEKNPGQKITFDMVAKQAGMTRENAYRNHFRGLPDILERIHFLIDGDIAVEFEEFTRKDNTDILKFLTKNILPLLYERKDWLRVLYGTNVDPDWLDFLFKKYTPLIEMYINKIGKNDVIPNNFLSQLIVKEFLAIVSVWITDRNPEAPSLFMKKFIHVLQQSPTDMITKN